MQVLMDKTCMNEASDVKTDLQDEISSSRIVWKTCPLVIRYLKHHVYPAE